MTRRIALALAAGAAFFAGAEGAAIAGDPDAADEAPTPGPAPALAIWDSEMRSASVDGVHIDLEDGTLVLSLEGSEAKSFDYEVRCETAMGSPMARVYVPPMEISKTRVEGRLSPGESMRVVLDLELDGDDGNQLAFAGAFDTYRVSIRPWAEPSGDETTHSPGDVAQNAVQNAPQNAAPLAILQMPRTSPDPA
jgi:hypothetical protein